MMLDDFFIRAMLAGVAVALAAGPLGCFVVWRRMAYFGDATAHAAILGVALALSFDVSVFTGALGVALVMAFTVTSLSGRGYAMDTLLGVIAHSALAFGLVAVSVLQGVRIDVMSYLFGDILAVGKDELAIIWGGAFLVLALVAWRWAALLLTTLSNDLAIADGINPRREQMILTLALAIVVAVSIKVVGVLLIAAMLIVPAASARALSRNPEDMAVSASLVGVASVLGGLQISLHWDTPAGPTIVCFATVIFVLSNMAASLLRARG